MTEPRYTATFELNSTFDEGVDTTRRSRYAEDLPNAYSYLDAMVDMAARARTYDVDVTRAIVSLYDEHRNRFPVYRLYKFEGGKWVCHVFDEDMAYTEHRDPYHL